MWPDPVSNSGPLTYKSCALPIALSGPARAGGARWDGSSGQVIFMYIFSNHLFFVSVI